MNLRPVRTHTVQKRTSTLFRFRSVLFRLFIEICWFLFVFCFFANFQSVDVCMFLSLDRLHVIAIGSLSSNKRKINERTNNHHTLNFVCLCRSGFSFSLFGLSDNKQNKQFRNDEAKQRLKPASA